MAEIYRTPTGGEAVRERYAAFLDRWPVPSEHRRVATSQGETFVVAFGPEGAPVVLLLHGSSANSASWMGDAPILAERLRVYAVDMILWLPEAGHILVGQGGALDGFLGRALFA